MSRTLDEILAEYKIGFVVGDKNVDKHVKEFKQAITQAMLDALPEKYENYYESNPVGKGQKIGYNQAISDMESTIKKIGDKDND